MRLFVWAFLLLSTTNMVFAVETPAPKVKSIKIDDTDLSIEFDRPMQTWLGLTDSNSINISPAVDCQWRWYDDTELECSTDKKPRQFKGANRYQVSFGEGFLSQEGVALAPTTLTVESDLPELGAYIYGWKDNLPLIRITADQSSTAEAIQKVLALSLNSKPLAYRLDKEDKDEDDKENDAIYRLLYDSGGVVDGLLDLRVKPGLQGEFGPLRGKQDGRLLGARINESFLLRTITCNSKRGYRNVAAPKDKPGAMVCSPLSNIDLAFSRKLSDASLEQIRKSLPDGFTVTISESNRNSGYDSADKEYPYIAPDVIISLSSKKAAVQYLFTPEQGIASSDGYPLIKTQPILFDIEDYMSSVEVKPGVLVQLPGDQNLPKLGVMNLKINTARMVQLGISDRVSEKRSSLKFREQKNQEDSPLLPKPIRQVQDRGGLLLAGSEQIFDLKYGIAYASFNVLSYESGNEILVWATQWQDGSAIAGAEVEILRLDAERKVHVIGTGKTDASGIAKLQIDATRFKKDDLMSLVRVKDKGSIVVSPAFDRAHNQLVLQDRHRDSRRDRFDDTDTLVFGASELPLYRPGETVNYRVWLRQKKANRLQTVAANSKVELSLNDVDQNKSLQKWKVDLDANASTAGKLQLSRLLPDGYYCVDLDELEEHAYYGKGACFMVARFEAQPLWVKLNADRTNVLAGQNLNFELEAGYFSGGPAAEVQLRYSGLTTLRRFEESFPEFESYTFINPFPDGDESETSAGSPVRSNTWPKVADAKGKAKFSLSFEQPLQNTDFEGAVIYGMMEFSAEVRISGEAAASSNTVAVNYSAYPKFVGLKTKDWWLQQDKDPSLEAVLISHEGKAIPGEAITVSIYQLKNKQQIQKGTCRLISGQASKCDFRAGEPGRYLFKAESKDAAPAEFIRYIGQSFTRGDDEEKPSAELRLLKAGDGVSSTRVMLQQPYGNATALFTLEYDHIVHYWVQTLSGNQTEIDIPVKADWAPGVTLRVLIRPAANSSASEAVRIATLDAVIDIDIPKSKVDAVSVKIAKPSHKPGDEIELLVSNPGNTKRYATISVLDESVYQQGSNIWVDQDPQNEHWLGVLGSWDVGSWYGFEGWRGDRYGEKNFFYVRGSDVIEMVTVNGRRIKRIVEEEGAQPVQVITRADIEKTGLNNVYEILNTINNTPGSTISFLRTNSEEAEDIEKVTVTGSKIKRASELFYRAPVTNLLQARAKNNPGRPMPRVRSQFVDAAYWNPDIVLEPGETKTIKFKLPDNLTQWRVLLWSNDSGDDFALTQTTFETSLPIEVRTGLPSQLFVGDRSSVQISARNQSERAMAITLSSALTGAGVAIEKTDSGKVAPYAALEQQLSFSPTRTGSLDVLSIADSAKETDGLSSGSFVQSRHGEEKIPQAGWLDLNGLNLTIPKLPSSAFDSKIDLQVSRGFDDWTEGWLKDLQDYPHRCWEQTLSRAVGGAYAQAYDKESGWSDRQITVNDAIQVAPSFQDQDGYFRYFQSENYRWNRDPNYVLSAYTLKSFRYLQYLGYTVPKALVEELETSLPARLVTGTVVNANGIPGIPWETAATIAGVIEQPGKLDRPSLEVLWKNWDKLSWFARSELVQAITRVPEMAELSKQGLQRLREAGEQHGLRQVIGDSRDFSYYMGSDLRDQCAVVSTLWKLDKSEDGRPARERLLRGIYDLYAGGTASLDTQSSAQCLMALHDVTAQNQLANTDANITVALDAKSQKLNLAADKREVYWQSPLAISNKKLSLATDNNAGGTMNYSAVVSYQYDLQQAHARSVGLNLQRHYDVLRNGKWVPLSNGSLLEGDWVRVRLVVTAPQERHFVAVSDFAPGGLVTRDISLSSVGGADVKKIGGNGSYYFDSRQTGSSVVRIYAEYLPAGRHEIYYYAQAVHPGDYFAPPAVAELMYGRASRANTAASRVVVRAK